MNADRILVGTNWLKVSGKHWGQKGRIESVGPRGPKMRFLGKPVQSPHGNYSQQFMRLDWNELGSSWQPDDKRSEGIYFRWTIGQPVKVTIDKNLTVIKTERENKEVPEESPQEDIEYVPCESSYHSPRFGIVPKVGTRTTRRGKIMCSDCTEKMRVYQQNKLAKPRLDQRETKVTEKPEKVSDSDDEYPWKVTIVETIIHTVWAKDFLDAAAKFDNAGVAHIVKIERL